MFIQQRYFFVLGGRYTISDFHEFRKVANIDTIFGPLLPWILSSKSDYTFLSIILPCVHPIFSLRQRWTFSTNPSPQESWFARILREPCLAVFGESGTPNELRNQWEGRVTDSVSLDIWGQNSCFLTYRSLQFKNICTTFVIFNMPNQQDLQSLWSVCEGVSR